MWLPEPAEGLTLREGINRTLVDSGAGIQTPQSGPKPVLRLQVTRGPTFYQHSPCCVQSDACTAPCLPELLEVEIQDLEPLSHIPS